MTGPAVNTHLADLVDHFAQGAPTAAQFLIGPGLPAEIAAEFFRAIAAKVSEQLRAGHEVDRILRALDLPPPIVDVSDIAEEIEELRGEGGGK